MDNFVQSPRVFKYQKLDILYGFYKNNNGIAPRITKSSYVRFKRKLKGLTNRSKAQSHRQRLIKINQLTTGWLSYFSKADSRKRITRIDEWLRHRLRCCIWKQWKKVNKTRIQNLQRLGVDKAQAYQWANTRKRYWRISGSVIIHSTINNKRLKQSGYKSILETYNRFHENLSNRRGTRTVGQTVH